MSLISNASLKSFLSKNNYVTSGDIPPEGHYDAVKQVESMVFSYSKIPIPQSIADAHPTLQFIAHSLYVWMILGQSDSDLTDNAYKRMEKLYDSAIKMLEDIRDGKIKITDSNGVPLVQTPDTKYYVSEDRSERL